MLTFNDISAIVKLKELENELENFVVACQAIDNQTDISDITELTYQNIGEHVKGSDCFAHMFHINHLRIFENQLLVTFTSHDGTTSDCGTILFPIEAFDNLDGWFKEKYSEQIQKLRS